MRDENFATPNFLGLSRSAFFRRTPFTKVIVQVDSSDIITSTPKIRLEKGCADPLLFMI